MSWAEMKKINSDLNTPLNVLDMINYIGMVGDNYIGLNDIQNSILLLQSDAIYANTVAVNTVGYYFWDYINNTTNNAGIIIAEAFQINSAALSAKATWAAIVADATAYSAVINNEHAFQSLLSNLNVLTPLLLAPTQATVIFNNLNNRKHIWFNDSVVNIIFSNSTLRSWLITNYATQAAINSMAVWTTITPKRALVFITKCTAVSASYQVRYYQPGDVTTATQTNSTDLAVNRKAFPLEINKLTGNSLNYAYCTWMVMEP